MEIKFLIQLALMVFIVLIGIDVFAVYQSHKEFAKFTLNVILGTFTLGSLLVALFGKYLHQLIDPVRLEIEVPAESNTVIDGRRIGNVDRKVFCHHLRVRNLTPHLTIKNCRIWLKAIYKLEADNQWRQPFIFAVPRLMRWAPHEVTPRERTFSKQQVFDFGQTIESDLGFEVTIDEQQQGTFNGVMPTRNRARYVFLVAADDYPHECEFTFEVQIPPSNPGELVIATVARVENFPKQW